MFFSVSVKNFCKNARLDNKLWIFSMLPWYV